MKLKILYRKNLKMSTGKIAAQCVHISSAIGHKYGDTVVVLSVTDSQFDKHRERAIVIQKDAGLTEVEPGTETCLAFYENEI